jgi:flavin-dependent dehydrogenase
VATGTRCDKYHATKDYSYRASQCAGNGWVLAGDAYGFLDPLYSSGVLLALRSGSLAADAVCQGLATGDLTAKTLGAWQEDYNGGMDRMRRLVVEYYEGFSFGRFVKKHPEYKGHLTDLLIGNLFNDHVGEVFPLIDKLKEETPEPARS